MVLTEAVIVFGTRGGEVRREMQAGTARAAWSEARREVESAIRVGLWTEVEPGRWRVQLPHEITSCEVLIAERDGE